MGDENDDYLTNSGWFRYLVIAALLSGAGGGVLNLASDTSDRYHKTEAIADQTRIRSELAALAVNVERLEKRMDNNDQYIREHLEHSAKYTAMIEDHESDIVKINLDVSQLEREFREYLARYHGGGK